MNAGSLLANEGGLEEDLWAPESLVTDDNDIAIRKLIGLFESRRLSSRLHLLVEVKGDECQLLLDVTNDLTLSGGGERVSTLGEDLHHVVRKITASKVKTDDG